MFRQANINGLLLIGFILVTGCGQQESKPVAPAPNPTMPMPGLIGAPEVVEVPAQFVAARKVFDMHCTKCHSTVAPTGDAKGAMLRKGPNLAKVGADAKHTRDWLIGYIRDPHSQKEKSAMPKFAGKISDDDLGALADYLGSLK